MSSFREPVGPLPPNVYWRRRLIVGIGLLALIIVILMIIFRPPSKDDGKPVADGPSDSQTADNGAADSGKDPSDGADSKPADEGADSAADGTGSSDSAANADGNADGGTTGKAAACDADLISLVAVADGTAYAKGENPKLRLRITNTGGTDCELNVGTSKQNFVITSGAETVWSSKQCETDAKDSNQVLKAGQELQTDELVWNRTKSSDGKCNAGPISAIADATYQFHVEVGTIVSDKIRLRILN